MENIANSIANEIVAGLGANGFDSGNCSFSHFICPDEHSCSTFACHMNACLSVFECTGSNNCFGGFDCFDTFNPPPPPPPC